MDHNLPIPPELRDHPVPDYEPTPAGRSLGRNLVIWVVVLLLLLFMVFGPLVLAGSGV